MFVSWSKFDYYFILIAIGDINWAKNVTVFKKLLSQFIDWLKGSKIKNVRNDVFCKEPFDRINWRYDNRDFGRVSSRTIGGKQDKTERTWEIEDKTQRWKSNWKWMKGSALSFENEKLESYINKWKHIWSFFYSLKPFNILSF